MFYLIDCPDAVEVVLNRVRKTYKFVIDWLCAASGQNESGFSSWLPYYCEKKLAVVQCDFICMLSPALARRFVLPAIEEEAQFLDHCCYHYDGPDALVHMEDILSIEAIDSIQWQPGAGKLPIIEWMDLLKRIQSAGKSVYIPATPEEVNVYHEELQPNKVFYDVAASSQQEGEALLNWLIANT